MSWLYLIGQHANVSTRFGVFLGGRLCWVNHVSSLLSRIRIGLKDTYSSLWGNSHEIIVSMWLNWQLQRFRGLQRSSDFFFASDQSNVHIYFQTLNWPLFVSQLYCSHSLVQNPSFDKFFCFSETRIFCFTKVCSQMLQKLIVSGRASWISGRGF